jgi:hypothetical protein
MRLKCYDADVARTSSVARDLAKFPPQVSHVQPVVAAEL